MKYLRYLFVALSLVIFISLSLFIWYRQGLLPVSSSDTKISFVVSRSESGNSVINRLGSAGLIRSATASKIYLRLSGLGLKLKPGGYVFTSTMSATQIFATLASGPRDIWVTLPEGWRREQIAVRLKDSLTDFDINDFLRLTAQSEGLLFPDTYLIPAQAAPADVLQIFLDNFIKKSNLDPDQAADRQILILASLIEREAKTEAERQLIAGILEKRLDNDWPLQVDASVQYAVAGKNCISAPLETCDWWPVISDTKYPSAYNTYINTGLPPGPVCNPGLASIQAAQNPRESDYWFYLTDPAGVTHYATSLDQHNQNIDKYLRP